MRKEQGIPNFPKNEEEVLKFWKEDKTFEKSLKKEDGKEIVGEKHNRQPRN